MNEILPINSWHYNFRNINDFKRDNIRSVGPILWSLVPIEIQNCTSLPAFKNCIRSWVPTNCPCRHSASAHHRNVKSALSSAK